MREFLSHTGVSFEERNIAKEPAWRKDLLELTGEIVVPVLVVGGAQVIGHDEERMASALGLQPERAAGNRDGLDAPSELTAIPDGSPLAHFVRRLQREMEFNAAKESSPYRDGQHDGMRFARDSILRILAGTYQPEEMVIDRTAEKAP